jgi:hypothetical protein
VRDGGLPLTGLYRHVRLVIRLVDPTDLDSSTELRDDFCRMAGTVVETTFGVGRERGLTAGTAANLLAGNRWFDREDDQ